MKTCKKISRTFFTSGLKNRTVSSGSLIVEIVSIKLFLCHENLQIGIHHLFTDNSDTCFSRFTMNHRFFDSDDKLISEKLFNKRTVAETAARLHPRITNK